MHSIKKNALAILISILCACNNANTTSSLPAQVNPTVQKQVPNGTREIFIPTLGITASIPSNFIKVSSNNMFRLFAPDNSIEFNCTWEKDLSHDQMKKSLIAGNDMGNDLFSRAIGESTVLSPNAEGFDFGVFQFNDAQQILNGYQVHDWSNSKGVLITSAMCVPEKATEIKSIVVDFYRSIKILNAQEILAMREKIKNDRITLGRNFDEQALYDKVISCALQNIVTTGNNPPMITTQRFELCENGNGTFRQMDGNNHIQQGQEYDISGKWDIVEDEDGVMLLVISRENGQEEKWVIGYHINGNVTIGGAEFTIHKKGNVDGPEFCG